QQLRSDARFAGRGRQKLGQETSFPGGPESLDLALGTAPDERRAPRPARLERERAQDHTARLPTCGPVARSLADPVLSRHRGSVLRMSLNNDNPAGARGQCVGGGGQRKSDTMASWRARGQAAGRQPARGRAAGAYYRLMAMRAGFARSRPRGRSLRLVGGAHGALLFHADIDLAGVALAVLVVGAVGGGAGRDDGGSGLGLLTRRSHVDSPGTGSRPQ